MANELSVMSHDALQKLVIGGDLSGLSPEQTMQYYAYRCKALDLDPNTKPFELIVLNGKKVLYATRETSNQLSSKREVSVTITSRTVVSGIYEVVARAVTPDGRTTDEIGCVPVDGLKGEALSNAMMKAVTKAKRRAVLSHCGLGMMDETEVDSVPRQDPPKPPTSPAPSKVVKAEAKIVSPPSLAVEPPPAPTEPSQPVTREEPTVIIDEPSASGTQHPENAEQGTFLKAMEKSGEKNGKPWTRYGVNIQTHGGAVWANTFDAEVGKYALSLAEGDEIMVVLAPGKPYNGQPTFNITYLRKL